MINLIQLHHRLASLWRNYSLLAVSITKLSMDDGWWWRRRWFPFSGAPNGLQNSPPMEEQEVVVAPYCKMRWTSSLVFSLRNGIYKLGIRSDGGLWDPQGNKVHPGGRRALLPCEQLVPPLVDLRSSIFYLFNKKSLQSFIRFRELLFLYKNNTMVVLLKTVSVWVSFIQIMQIRVQNKGISVRKSRYVGYVSLPNIFITYSFLL